MVLIVPHMLQALEAMFVMWRMTGDPIYREWGWTMFQVQGRRAGEMGSRRQGSGGEGKRVETSSRRCTGDYGYVLRGSAMACGAGLRDAANQSHPQSLYPLRPL